MIDFNQCRRWFECKTTIICQYGEHIDHLIKNTEDFVELSGHMVCFPLAIYQPCESDRQCFAWKSMHGDIHTRIMAYLLFDDCIR